MGAVEATVKIIGEVAWPAAVVVAVIILRLNLARAIDGLAERLLKIKAGPAEFEFAAKTQAAAEQAEIAVPAPPPTIDIPAEFFPGYGRTLPHAYDFEQLLRLAEERPRQAVHDAWELVYAAKRTTEEHAQSVVGAARSLAARDKLSPELVSVAETLEYTEGGLAPKKRLPPEIAHDFVEAAWRLASAFMAAAPIPLRMPPPGPRTGRPTQDRGSTPR